MRVDDKIRDTIVGIGAVSNAGSFITFGTGFIVVNSIGDVYYQNVVTARHVIDTITSIFGRSGIHARVNTNDGGARVINLTHWHNHPDGNVDLSICPSMIDREVFDIRMLEIESDLVLTPEIIDEEDIGVGCDVAAVGMFVQRTGEARNLPIVRSGIISAMLEEKIQTQYGYHDAYLIETRSFDGLSGSPVFVQLPPLRYKMTGKGHELAAPNQTHYLMGMLIGHNEVRNEQDIIEIKAKGSKIDDREVVPLFNTGIGIVLPFHYVEEAIGQPDVHDRRVEAKKGSSTFVVDSAKRELPTKADNPQHKEDFNSLLGAAARKRPQGDQT